MRRIAILFVLSAFAAAILAVPTAAHGPKHGGFGTKLQKTVALPTGFQPEGIAISGKTFFVGSIPTGAIFSGNLRTGEGEILVPGAEGRAAIGVEFDKRWERLFVAGGPTGKAFVYDAVDGELLKEYQLTDLSPRFVNDVVVTRNAAWFTDSNNQQLYKVAIDSATGNLADAAETVPLTGDLSFSEGFNTNGIDATKGGRWLVIVQSNEGKLFRVATKNGVAGVTKEIALTGGDANVVNGDGLLLDQRTLYVVQNQLDKIAVVKLNFSLTKGKIVRYLTDPAFDVPTTIDDVKKKNLIYAVNARFNRVPDPATAEYSLVRVKTKSFAHKRWGDKRWGDDRRGDRFGRNDRDKKHFERS